MKTLLKKNFTLEMFSQKVNEAVMNAIDDKREYIIKMKSQSWK